MTGSGYAGIGIVLALALLIGGTAQQASAAECRFVLGFQALHDLLPSAVGECLENEHHNPENGDALQRTAGGLLVWRKADNWTAFTDGYRTWINGALGLQQRLNSERFRWEVPGLHSPAAVVPYIDGTSQDRAVLLDAEGAYSLLDQRVIYSIVVPQVASADLAVLPESADLVAALPHLPGERGVLVRVLGEENGLWWVAGGQRHRVYPWPLAVSPELRTLPRGAARVLPVPVFSPATNPQPTLSSTASPTPTATPTPTPTPSPTGTTQAPRSTATVTAIMLSLFSNIQHRFSLNIPVGWEIQQDRAGAIAVLRGPNADASDGREFAANITVQRIDSDGLDLEAFARRERERLRQGYVNASEKSDLGRITVGAYAAMPREFELTDPATNLTLHIRQLLVLRDSSVYVVTAASLAAAWDNYVGLFQRVLGSVEFRP
ncbi:MAG: hypothetical protein CL878_00130 [Dehalococcoidia bacterium]|nr:hypothetical protein [Dehalococcoidia bacterium]